MRRRKNKTKNIKHTFLKKSLDFQFFFVYLLAAIPLLAYDSVYSQA